MDHTVPWAIVNASYKQQQDNPDVTEIVKIKGRGHALVIDGGWREVADTGRRPTGRGRGQRSPRPRYRQVVRALVWQRRATGLAIEADRPGYVLEALGPVPASTRGRRAWRQAAAEIEQYRRTHQVTDRTRQRQPTGEPTTQPQPFRAAVGE